MDRPFSLMYRLVQVITMVAFCILFNSGLYSQSAVLTTGNNGSGSGGTVSYSVGQVAYTHVNSPSGEVTLGVQQPNLVIVVGTNDPLPTISAGMYPNPVSTYGVLELSGSSFAVEPSDCSFELYDISGRLLLQQEIVEQTTQVSMDRFENSMYLLKVSCQGAEIKTFKVIKTN